MRLFAALLLLAVPAAIARNFELADVHRVVELSAPVFSKDNRSIAYAATASDLARDRKVSDVFVVDYETGKRRNLTNSPKASEWHPAWAPDGKTLCWLSDNTKTQQTQLFCGKRQVTRLAGGVSDFSLAPDGQKAVVVAETSRERKASDPIVISRYMFKEDGRDYLYDGRRQHLFLVDLKTGKAEQLTSGDFDHWQPSWSPDGKWIALVSKRTGADPDRNLDYNVYVMAPQQGTPLKRVSAFEGTDQDPYWESEIAWSPDSRRLAYLTSGEEKWIYYAPWQITVADLETGTETPLARVDRNMTRLSFAPDGKALYALKEESRVTRPVRIDLEDGDITPLGRPGGFAFDMAVSAGGRIALLDGDDHTPFALYALEGENQRLIAGHNDWLKDVTLANVEDISFTSSGGAQIDGFLVKPAGYVPGKKYPTILRLHGGPVYQFSHEFKDDWQLYAAHGYVVIGVNPRGSSGRGFDFARAIYARWGTVDVDDALAAVDHVVKSGIADPKRLGVGGRSYGSILTNAVIVSDSRFKAAVSQSGASNYFGIYGHDQYTPLYDLELGPPWENLETYITNSAPFLEAQKIVTPTLFQCAEKDANVPCHGSEQMYQALRTRGIPTQLVIYPGENHAMTVPSHIHDQYQRNLDWYARLKTE